MDWKVATNSSGIRATRARDSCARYTAAIEGSSRARGARGAGAVRTGPPEVVEATGPDTFVLVPVASVGTMLVTWR
ncbi:hypothetical protein ACFPN0_08260 [Kitasatospora cinereorecta]